MPSRRDLLAGAGAVGAAALAGCTGDLSADPGNTESYEWPTGGADPRNSRSVPDGAAPRDGVDVDWTLDLETSRVWADPVVADGTAVVATGTDVVAVDLESRERLWSVAPENRGVAYTGAATIRDGTAYVSDVRTLLAVDVESGDPLWEYEFDYTFLDHSPTYDERRDRVYAAAGEYVRAFDAESGEIVWERRLFGVVQGSVAHYHAAPGIHLFVATEGGELYAMDTEGRVYWRRRLPQWISAAPTVIRSDDRSGGSGVVVGCGDGNLYCFDAAGTEQWTAEVGAFAEGKIAVGHGGVFVRDGSTLYAFDADEGEEAWRVDVGRDGRNPPIVVGDTIYVGGDRLRALDLEGGVGVREYRLGATRFEYDPDDPVSFVTAADGVLYAVVERPDSGAELRALS